MSNRRNEKVEVAMAVEISDAFNGRVGTKKTRFCRASIWEEEVGRHQFIRNEPLIHFNNGRLGSATPARNAGYKQPLPSKKPRCDVRPNARAVALPTLHSTSRYTMHPNRSLAPM